MDHRGDGALVMAASVLGTSALLARAQRVGPVEQRVFRAINRDAGPAERPIWLLMQFGNGLTAGVAPLVLRLAGRSWGEAARVSLAAGGGWNLAKLVKSGVARGRPAVLLEGVALRDGDPGGRGFVSGHATVAMSVALAAAPMVSGGARAALVTAAVGVGLARVHVGAHLPLDVVGALALATLWGTACARIELVGAAS
jgi:undecaprenyl-diphosphatase